MTGLDPLSIVTWLPRWIGTAQLRNSDILEVLNLSPDQLGAAISANPNLGKTDRWLARNLQVCFYPTKESVVAYHQMLPTNPALMRSGGLPVATFATFGSVDTDEAHTLTGSHVNGVPINHIGDHYRRR